MKLAKFIYPMFLVAIGLHGLLLFVPVGGTSEAELIEEDVELSDLPTPAAAKAEAARSQPTGTLPVPTLNLSTGAATSAKPATAARTAATPRVAARQPAAAGATSRTRATPTTPAAARPAAGNSAQSGAGTRASAGASDAGSRRSPSSAASTERRNTAPRTNLPDLSAANSSRAATDDNSAGSRSNAGGPLNLSGLIASVTKAAPEALDALRSDFAEDYTYADKNTDAAGLEDRRSHWIDKISLLANADSSTMAEKIEPIVLNDSKLNYPIERSARSDRRASRICLDDPLPNNAEVAVLFDAQGNVVGTPEMTLSSGYPAIDKEIIAIVTLEGFVASAEAESLPETRPKAYLRAFEIDYAADRCLTLPKLKK